MIYLTNLVGPQYPLGTVSETVYSQDQQAPISSNQVSLRAGGTYLQSDYPGLFQQIGLIYGSNFTPRLPNSVANINAMTVGGVSSSNVSVNINDLTYMTTTGTGGNSFGQGYLSVSDLGTISTSTDSVSWTFQSSPTDSNLLAVTKNTNGSFPLYLAVGASGTLITSNDAAITWTTVTTLNTTAQFNDVISTTGPRTIIGGNSGTLIWSGSNFQFGEAVVPGITANVKSFFATGGNTQIDDVALCGGSGLVLRSRVASPEYWSSRGLNVTGLQNHASIYTSRNFGGSNDITWGANSGLIRTSDIVVAPNWRIGALTNTTSNIHGIIWAPLPTAQFGTFVAFGAGGMLQTTTDFFIRNWVAQTSGTTSTINCGAYGAGLYVIAGAGGMLRSSTDAVTWTTRTSGITGSINDMIFANNQFVYVAAAGALRTSTDGITWTARTSGTGTTVNILSVTFGNSLYVYGVSNGTLRTSTDGVTWTARTTGTSSAINVLRFGGGLYMLGGAGSLLASSTDAITWDIRDPGFVGSENINNIEYHAATNIWYYATALGRIGSSTDGATWVSIPNVPTGTANELNSIILGNSLWVAAGASGTLVTSTDLVTWTTQSSGTTNTINTLTFHSNIYYYAGANGTLASSTDAVTWTQLDSQTLSSVSSLIRGDEFVMSTANGGILTSTDGTAWEYGRNLYLAGGDQGTLYASDNGTEWNQISIGTVSSIQTMTYGKGIFVAGGPGFLRTSPTGQAWTSASTTTIATVFYSNNTYIAAGGTVLLTSTDAVTWTARTSGATGSIISLTYGSGLYVFGTTTGLLRSSTNGVAWTTRDSGVATSINALSSDGTNFLYGSTSGTLGTSTDGITWQIVPQSFTGITSTINAISSMVGNYVVVGASGSVASSTDGVAWHTRYSGITNDLRAVIHADRILVAGGNTVASSDSISTVEYSPYYDVQTEFVIPTLQSYQISGFNTGFDNVSTNIYVKARG
jgi:hypothetical protein